MEWLGNGGTLRSKEDPACGHISSGKGVSGVYHQKQFCDCAMESLCENQQRCVKASIVTSWRLAEAQDQLCSLRVHNSESLDQERARIQSCPTDVANNETEWRRKENLLGSQESSSSTVLGVAASWDAFDRSIINVQTETEEMDQDKCKTFLQRFEQEIRHFGMLRRWDDSQRFLSSAPQLICEETANFLIIWCIRLQQEGKEALMEQVAHQAVVMQFILEMASNSQQDPRGCFRQFFHKAKDGQDVYLEVFHGEVEAFKQRVKEYTESCGSDASVIGNQNTGTSNRVDCKESTDSQVGECNQKHCSEAGLYINPGKWTTKEENTETEDILMMETA